MIGSGVYFAVDGQTVKKLRSLGAKGAAEYIIQELEPLYFDEFPEQTFEVEEYWEAIHRALTGDFLFDGSEPMSEVILGGELLSYDGYIVSAKPPEQVSKLCGEIASLTESDFDKGYSAIDTADYPDKSAEDCEEAFGYLKDSLSFWRFAAEHGLWVLFTAEI
ncbi:protein of unknown function [Ruminococcus sp. YE71]|uniref:DUF1877 family protein n=1 Tax=unclassified Ruminococcus TaxID=2608920 RepID=UPI00088133E4|nr:MULTISPECIES: DUF1877 family protein [unclassified Ruminococcus]SDA11999.1 protein of unknown function [Ruminococcus sp. YE78]SFW16065.1 protein of unknown function [Ruminococcus sp. YE71]